MVKRGDITREKILKAALNLFVKQGIDCTATSEITKKVGISEGALFRHFNTKKDLVESLYVSIKKNALTNLMREIDFENSVEENVKTITRKSIEHFVKNYRELIFMELVENDPKVSEEVIAFAKKEYVEISKFTENWKKIGALKNVDTEILHQSIWGISCAIIKYCKKNKITKVDDIYLDMVWAAVKK